MVPFQRSIHDGYGYGITFTIIMSAVVAPYFFNVLAFLFADFVFFYRAVILIFVTWSWYLRFGRSGKYGHTAASLSFSYLVIFATTYFAYQIDHAYTITGSPSERRCCFLVFLMTSAMMFRRPDSHHGILEDYFGLGAAYFPEFSPIMFISSITGYFLDKVIVWYTRN